MRKQAKKFLRVFLGLAWLAIIYPIPAAGQTMLVEGDNTVLQL
jgi:hypothetical protein